MTRPTEEEGEDSDGEEERSQEEAGDEKEEETGGGGGQPGKRNMISSFCIHIIKDNYEDVCLVKFVQCIKTSLSGC